MNLYLLRHAHALDLGEGGAETDEERPLSEEGYGQVARLAEALKKWDMSFEVVLTSPLVRAMQTAEALVKGMGATVEIVTLEQLSPGWSPKKLSKSLFARDEESILMVGHEPEISRQASRLIGDKEARIAFAKGALACIRCEGAPRKGVGELLWLVTPKLLG